MSAITNHKIPRSVGTHDGSFHADEVTACALLLLFNLIDEDKIIRSRDLKTLSSCEYLCDVGGTYNKQLKQFDHHQAEYQGPLSSAGMVLAYLKEEGILTAKEYDLFNHVLILGVDAHDNGKELQAPGVTTFSHIITNFNPIVHEADPATEKAAFYDALHFVLGHLKRMRDRFFYIQSCQQIVAECMNLHKECLIFHKSIPWMDTFFELDGAKHPALFVIMPCGHHWKLRGIPPTNDERMKVRIPLPQEWAGLLEKELKMVSGIPGAIFCHKGRFISVWETLPDAIEALNYTLKIAKEKL